LPDEERTYSLEGRAPIARTRRMGLSTCEACGATYPSAPQCPRCGFAAPAKPAPRVVRGSVDRVEATATRAERAAHLAQLRAVARRRSLPEAWVRAKYFQRWKRAAEAELSDVA
jgi:ribosomal protein L40E